MLKCSIYCQHFNSRNFTRPSLCRASLPEERTLYGSEDSWMTLSAVAENNPAEIYSLQMDLKREEKTYFCRITSLSAKNAVISRLCFLDVSTALPLQVLRPVFTLLSSTTLKKKKSIMTIVRRTTATMGGPNNSSRTQVIFVPTLKNMTLTLLQRSRSVQQA